MVDFTSVSCLKSGLRISQAHILDDSARIELKKVVSGRVKPDGASSWCEVFSFPVVAST